MNTDKREPNSIYETGSRFGKMRIYYDENGDIYAKEYFDPTMGWSGKYYENTQSFHRVK
jgi:hypothetical protein